MRMVMLDTNSTRDFSDKGRWPEAVRADCEAADIVIGLFSPHAPLILKAPEGFKLAEYRMGRGYAADSHVIRMDGEHDPALAGAQNARLRTDADRDADWWLSA